MIEASGSSSNRAGFKKDEALGIMVPKQEADTLPQGITFEKNDDLGILVPKEPAEKPVTIPGMGEYVAIPVETSPGLVTAKLPEAMQGGVLLSEPPKPEPEPEKTNQPSFGKPESDAAPTEVVAEDAEKQRKEKLAQELAQEVNFVLTVGTYNSLDSKASNPFAKLFPLSRNQKRTYYTREQAGIKQETFRTSDSNATFKDALTSYDMDLILSLYHDSNTGKAFPGEASVRYIHGRPLEDIKTGEQHKCLFLAIGLPKAVEPNKTELAQKNGVDADYFIMDLSPESAQKLFEESLRDPAFLKLFMEKLVAPTNANFMKDYGEISSVLMGRQARWDAVKLLKDPQRDGANPLYNYDNGSHFIISNGAKAIVSNVPLTMLSSQKPEDFPPKTLNVKDARFSDFEIII